MPKPRSFACQVQRCPELLRYGGIRVQRTPRQNGCQTQPAWESRRTFVTTRPAWQGQRGQQLPDDKSKESVAEDLSNRPSLSASPQSLSPIRRLKTSRPYLEERDFPRLLDDILTDLRGAEVVIRRREQSKSPAPAAVEWVRPSLITSKPGFKWTKRKSVIPTPVTLAWSEQKPVVTKPTSQSNIAKNSSVPASTTWSQRKSWSPRSSKIDPVVPLSRVFNSDFSTSTAKGIEAIREREDNLHIIPSIQKPTEPVNKPKSINAEEDVLQELILPLSPLMDPKLVEARTKWKSPKPKTSHTRTDIQIKLEKNPYASMLSGPIRKCSVTGARLPTGFLIRFNLEPHPRTGKLWMMPLGVALSKQEQDQAAKENRSIKARGTDDQLDNSTPSANGTTDGRPSQYNIAEPAELEPSSSPNPLASSSNLEVPEIKPLSKNDPSSYILATFPTLSQIPKLPKRSLNRSNPHRWKERHGAQSLDIVFRPDMASLILSLLRQKVAHWLGYLASLEQNYLRTLTFPTSPTLKPQDPLTDHPQAAAILWLGSPNSQHRALLFGPTSSDRSLFAIAGHNINGMGVPVFDLATLLGEEVLAGLRQRGHPFSQEAVVVKGKRVPNRGLEAVWKLVGYLGPGGVEAVDGAGGLVEKGDGGQ